MLKNCVKLFFVIFIFKSVAASDFPNPSSITYDSEKQLFCAPSSKAGKQWQGALVLTGTLHLSAVMRRVGERLVSGPQYYLYHQTQQCLLEQWSWRFKSASSGIAEYTTAKNQNILLRLLLEERR